MSPNSMLHRIVGNRPHRQIMHRPDIILSEYFVSSSAFRMSPAHRAV